MANREHHRHVSNAWCWPHGEEAAVSLRFDDGLDSHRLHVAPLLDSYGLRGTFYLCPSGTQEHWKARADLWHPLLEAGHEIGNHTLSHPVPVALADRLTPHCYEAMTLEAYQEDVLEAQRRLESVFGGREWTFCYPCYQTWVGAGVDRRSVVPFVAEHFAAACTGGEVSRPFNPPAWCDLHALMSVHMEGLAAEQMIERLGSACGARAWAILTFHDVGADRLSVARSDFEVLLQHLDRCRGRIWTAPVVEVARHVRAARLAC